MQSVTSLNAHRKRQRRQAAGALVTGLFSGGGGNNSSNPSPTAEASATNAAKLTEHAPTVPYDAAPVKKPTKKKSTAQPRPEIQIPPRGIGPIYEPSENDVLCGRGGRINAHTGNVRFRDIVVQRKKDYLAPTTKKLEKAHIAADIVRDIRNKDPAGRFLKEDPDGSWYDIGDAKAIKKVGQALREDAPDIREDVGSDEEGGETSPSKDAKPKKAPQPTEKIKTPKQASKPIQTASAHIPLATVNISTATAVSGRGGKVVTTQSSQRSVSSQQSKATYSSFQPILPPTQEQGPSKTIFPGMRGRGAKTISGAAAAAMRHSDDTQVGYSENQTPDVAFGRKFHVPETGGESSMLSGMSANTGANPSAISGMSGISALTDPISTLSIDNAEFQQPIARPQTAQQFQAMRYNQLQQLRQQWAQGSQRTLESADMRSIGSNSLQRSHSWQESTLQNHLGENMSWTDNSLIGGGIHDGISMMSGQNSSQSHYFRGQMTSEPTAPFTSEASNSYTAQGVAPVERHVTTPQLLQHQQGMAPPMPTGARFYSHNGSNSEEESSSVKTNRIAGGGNASVASMSLASASLSGSIMSDLSENLLALDLAEPRLLGHFGEN